ncbi:hypothetical protein N836_22960 [Leptolyngbya sp. Heron Island J]|nr:hypothetical protein N836_22960 [Leptolyngbya sp. Heron Island J]
MSSSSFSNSDRLAAVMFDNLLIGLNRLPNGLQAVLWTQLNLYLVQRQSQKIRLGL